MSYDDFMQGKPFAVFGLGYDLKYNSFNERVEVQPKAGDKLTNVLEPHSYILFDSQKMQFTCKLLAFGVRQVVTVSLSVCELKE